jgi:hypothetical protein
MYPNSKFIHMVRDGRDVALSFMNTEFGPSELWDNAMFWRSRVNITRFFCDRIGRDRFIEVKYENLILKPEQELKRICEFLEEEYSDDMLNGNRKDFEIMHHSHQLVSEKPDATRIGVWKINMGKNNLRNYEALNNDILACYGYDCTDRGKILCIWARIRYFRYLFTGKAYLKRFFKAMYILNRYSSRCAE